MANPRALRGLGMSLRRYRAASQRWRSAVGGWVAAAGRLALVVLGALLSVWAYSSLGNAQQVIAVRADISRGEVITEEALQVVRVGVDPALQVVPAADLGLLVGQRAGADLRAGQLVVPSAVDCRKAACAA